MNMSSFFLVNTKLSYLNINLKIKLLNFKIG